MLAKLEQELALRPNAGQTGTRTGSPC